MTSPTLRFFWKTWCSTAGMARSSAELFSLTARRPLRPMPPNVSESSRTRLPTARGTCVFLSTRNSYGDPRGSPYSFLDSYCCSYVLLHEAFGSYHLPATRVIIMKSIALFNPTVNRLGRNSTNLFLLFTLCKLHTGWDPDKKDKNAMTAGSKAVHQMFLSYRSNYASFFATLASGSVINADISLFKAAISKSQTGLIYIFLNHYFHRLGTNTKNDKSALRCYCFVLGLVRMNFRKYKNGCNSFGFNRRTSVFYLGRSYAGLLPIPIRVRKECNRIKCAAATQEPKTNRTHAFKQAIVRSPSNRTAFRYLTIPLFL